MSNSFHSRQPVLQLAVVFAAMKVEVRPCMSPPAHTQRLVQLLLLADNLAALLPVTPKHVKIDIT